MQAEDMVLYAWVGRNDDFVTRHNNREHGIKQAICPVGTIPMVACKEEKMREDYVVDQMKECARVTGIQRQLVRFTFDRVILSVDG